MKYVVGMCIPSFVKIGSAIQKLIWGGYSYRHTHTHTHTYTHSQQGDLISLPYFLLFVNKESRLKTRTLPHCSVLPTGPVQTTCYLMGTADMLVSLSSFSINMARPLWIIF
jgi:hypothetical protein